MWGPEPEKGQHAGSGGSRVQATDPCHSQCCPGAPVPLRPSRDPSCVHPDSSVSMALLLPSLNRSESPYGLYFGRLWNVPRTHSLRHIPESCPWPGDFALASGERRGSRHTGPLAKLGTLRLTDNPLPPTACRPPGQTVRLLQVTQLPAGRWPRAEPRSTRVRT